MINDNIPPFTPVASPEQGSGAEAQAEIPQVMAERIACLGRAMTVLSGPEEKMGVLADIASEAQAVEEAKNVYSLDAQRAKRAAHFVNNAPDVDIVAESNVVSLDDARQTRKQRASAAVDEAFLPEGEAA